MTEDKWQKMAREVALRHGLPAILKTGGWVIRGNRRGHKHYEPGPDRSNPIIEAIAAALRQAAEEENEACERIMNAVKNDASVTFGRRALAADFATAIRARREAKP